MIISFQVYQQRELTRALRSLSGGTEQTIKTLVSPPVLKRTSKQHRQHFPQILSSNIPKQHFQFIDPLQTTQSQHAIMQFFTLATLLVAGCATALAGPLETRTNPKANEYGSTYIISFKNAFIAPWTNKSLTQAQTGE